MSGRVAAVEAYYQSNAATFDHLEAMAEADFDIPRDVIRATLKRRMVMGLVSDTTQLDRPVVLRVELVKVLWVMLCCLASILRPARLGRMDADLLVEVSHPTALIILEPVLDAVQDLRIGYWSRSRDGLGGVPDPQLALRPARHRYCRSAALMMITSLFRRFPGCLLAGNRAEMLHYYVILLRKVGLYTTDMAGIEAACMLSADHMSWSWLRHFLYRRGGAGPLLLIQNGQGGTENGDTYTASDTYFGFGEEVLTAIAGFRCGDFRAVGSFALHRAKRKLESVPLTIDIAFLEGVVVDDTPSWCSASYDLILTHLARLKEEHPHLRVVVAMKTASRAGLDEPYSAVLARRDAQLTAVGIQFSEQLGAGSYDVLAASRLAVTYTSAMGFEALGFNRPFLFCNYDGFVFLPPADDMAILGDRSYEAFETRVLTLLAGGKESDAYFAEMRRRFLCQSADPPNEVVEVIRSLSFGARQS